MKDKEGVMVDNSALQKDMTNQLASQMIYILIGQQVNNGKKS